MARRDFALTARAQGDVSHGIDRADGFGVKVATPREEGARAELLSLFSLPVMRKAQCEPWVPMPVCDYIGLMLLSFPASTRHFLTGPRKSLLTGCRPLRSRLAHAAPRSPRQVA